jgi:hypothetical protein
MSEARRQIAAEWVLESLPGHERHHSPHVEVIAKR